jgi:hypothetical protein
MALRAKTIKGQFANATAVLLAASASVTRYVRSVHITNNTGGALTWNLAYAATATSAGPGFFGAAIAANAPYDRYYGGKGERLDNTAISGFASAATSVSFEINYDESDALDA